MSGERSGAVSNEFGRTRHAKVTDGELLATFRAGRGESADHAFAALLRRHGPMVLRVCHQVHGDWHDAEDAFQSTFLVLARRPGSIGRPELLGNWLYGVALRTAWEARSRAGRRRCGDGQVARAIEGEPSTDSARPEASVACREELEILHEELSRLPEAYRIPVVLCELEGLSYREAALRLRCPVGTVGVRLGRARERLRARLLRRGIVPAAALTKAMIGEGGVSACVSPMLIDASVRAAAGLAAGKGATIGLATPAASAIAAVTLRSLAAPRRRLAAGVTLAMGIAATIGWFGWHLPATASPPTGGGSTGPMIVATPLARGAASIMPRGSTATPTMLPAASLPPGAGPEPAGGAPGTPSVVLREKGSTPVTVLASATGRRPIRDEQARGELLFAKEWVPDDPASRGGDGLGPVYNETSCMACHSLGAPGGAGPENRNVVIVTEVSVGGRGVPRELDRIHPGFLGARSVVLHRYGTDPEYGSWRRRFLEPARGKAQPGDEAAGEDTVEARIRTLRQQAAPGRRLRDRSDRLQPTPGVTLRVSERNSPALFGAGRIDAIPSDVLIEEAARQDAAVRGRVGRDREGHVGRFGWKAQVASLHEFVRGACASELGLEVTGHPQSPSPLAAGEKPRGLDLTEPDCDALVAFVRSLPAPVAIDPAGPHGSKDMEAGRRLFDVVGCASCHAPSRGELRGIYSDLLLHDMGPGLGDSGSSYGIEGPEIPGGPRAGEWRTPPLWGYRDSGPYLHDGRAETLEEAIAWHGGQGAPAARRFFALPAEDRFRLEAFLKSLVAPSATARPGVMLAAELESRIVPDEVRGEEAAVRRQREEAEALEVRMRRELQDRRKREEAERRAQGRFLSAVNLEKAGKIKNALQYYREIARDVPDTHEGRSAVARIAELSKR